MSDVCDYYKRILLSCLSKRYEETFAPFEEINFETKYEDAAIGSVIKHLDENKRQILRQRGLESIRDGRVALVILAGGQSTRLGKNGNKSLVQITPNGSKTLLQLHLERVRRVCLNAEMSSLSENANESTDTRNRAEGKVIETGKDSGTSKATRGNEHENGNNSSSDSKRPLVYILTSVFNKNDIQGYLDKNGYFGLDPNLVVLLEQKNVPCFFMNATQCKHDGESLSESTPKGSMGGNYQSKLIDSPRSIFETRRSVFTMQSGEFHMSSDGNPLTVEVLVDSKGLITAPNGNGNIFECLHNCHSFMKHLENLDHLHVIAVDNALSRPLDPEFIGLGLHFPFDTLNKCIKKKENENLGIFCVGKHPCIVEYSELDRITSDSPIRQNDNFYGNICDHLFSGPFLRRIMDYKAYLEMPYHVAKKAIPYWDGTQFVYPDSINGYKLELFIFDVMKFAEKVLCLEVDREDSFAPVKRAYDFDWENNDNSVQYKMDIIYKKWLKSVKCNVDGIFCEISPLLSYSGEGLEEYSGCQLTAPILLDKPSK
ncbi:UDP-N-acetylglucosamine pyrophosphorylase, putative [Theileria equi strain WA]|uniref:UDP-N-acetylglucosamine diphosphorylase n=1 Tax=Theileria equi strain WA TaxID=1537102 RepID=L0AXS0_THEEQ|nr:UDP-N-acetylglucosamine pyrophosphorylase, putative [Theileria equi strain WA]AFZ80048.1 UDP-N-acetylglucosamine pyrophosphorylase, putative [Theileria equi strain WA]|eukprot:XP_004829714.1 UDP-N-acetylglucosamine pyrophosphorylase, putative [Theileria equi strain WA]